MLRKQELPFERAPEKYASFIVPRLSEWHEVWSIWDTITREMIPKDELLKKPIKLRNACIFYLGHIPTFLDMKLHEATGAKLCDPSYYPTIFERGIDPDVDDPENCHAHSEIPEEWPPLEEILDHQTLVREKVNQLYKAGMPVKDRQVGRVMWLGLEHEMMHLETLLYMLLQSDNVLPPPNVVRPDFEGDAELAKSARVPNEWFSIPQQTITIGMHDPEDNSDGDRHFGWCVHIRSRPLILLLTLYRDNEKPARKFTVPAFQAKGRAITNEEVCKRGGFC